MRSVQALAAAAAIIGFVGAVQAQPFAEAKTSRSGYSGGAIAPKSACDALGTAKLTTGSAGNSTLNGVISGSGALVKEGSGTFTLAGANSYSGGTFVRSSSRRLPKSPPTSVDMTWLSI